MLWLWIGDLLKKVAVLFIPPRSRPRRVNPNTVCPACGHKQGYIEFRKMTIGEGRPVMAMVVHTCIPCGCKWAEEPVAAAKWPVD